MQPEPRTDPAMRRALRVQYRNHSAVIAAVDDADALAGALADVERLRRALAWYADELHYSRLVGDMPGTPSPVIADGGAIARAALGTSLAPDGGSGNARIPPAPDPAAAMASWRATAPPGATEAPMDPTFDCGRGGDAD